MSVSLKGLCSVEQMERSKAVMLVQQMDGWMEKQMVLRLVHWTGCKMVENWAVERVVQMEAKLDVQKALQKEHTTDVLWAHWTDK